MKSVLLVRHADIDLPANSPDPALNAAGRMRAETLADSVEQAGVTAIFTSALLRTRQTVAPLADRLGILSQEAPESLILAEKIRTGTLGETVLIAGHSNTVPAMIEAFGVVPPIPVITEREFDHLYLVTTAGKTARLLHLKYGRRTA
jgi:broad specificity phosphatase PhoE